jgi:hypothetical protein
MSGSLGFTEFKAAFTETRLIEPFAYLKDVLERLPTNPQKALGELLPDARSEAHPGARRRGAPSDLKSTRWLKSSNAVILSADVRFNGRSPNRGTYAPTGPVP